MKSVFKINYSVFSNSDKVRDCSVYCENLFFNCLKLYNWQENQNGDVLSSSFQFVLNNTAYLKKYYS